MVCRRPLLRRSHYRSLALKSSYNPVNSVKEILTINLLLVSSCRCERRLVADIGDVGSGEARRVLGHKSEVEVLSDLEVACVNLEYLFPFLQFRKIHVNLAVETSGAQKRLVEDVSPVCGRKDYHT